ncbi:hypothetical protein [Paenibacillus sp. H1-7]|uniref:hypothetical protein n=1 Tax=Paenibacillus sp. H1-7 TaxID=2282849 RepID=UPI001EF87B2D|nr:hypothetical protein [Paenibacillus sp. H1-7]
MRTVVWRRCVRVVLMSVWLAVFFTSLVYQVNSSHAFAQSKFEPPSIPPVISLLEDTPLYPEQDESEEPWALLSPQDVETVEAENEWYTKESGEKVWIRVKTTWLGELWIHLEKEKIGVIKPIDSYILLLGPAQLYSQPAQSSKTDVVLTPQVVHANAIFDSSYSYLTNSYRIETSWVGDQWLVSNPYMLVNVEVLNQEMVLPTETLFMEEYDTAYRLQRPSDARFIPPQKVFALERTENGEYHVRGENGDTFWIHPAYAEPQGSKKINETIELTKLTELHLFPQTSHPIFGLLSPQKVEAFEQWDDSEGHRWYRIHSWNGDLWIQPDSSL